MGVCKHHGMDVLAYADNTEVRANRIIDARIIDKEQKRVLAFQEHQYGRRIPTETSVFEFSY